VQHKYILSDQELFTLSEEEMKLYEQAKDMDFKGKEYGEVRNFEKGIEKKEKAADLYLDLFERVEDNDIADKLRHIAAFNLDTAGKYADFQEQYETMAVLKSEAAELFDDLGKTKESFYCWTRAAMGEFLQQNWEQGKEYLEKAIERYRSQIDARPHDLCNQQELLKEAADMGGDVSLIAHAFDQRSV